MDNKEQFLRILKNSPQELWDKFWTCFGYDDWCAALIDFPEAQTIFLKKQNLVDEILNAKPYKNSNEQRQEIIDAYSVYLYENKGKNFNDYERPEELGQGLAKRIRKIKLEKLLN